MSQTTTKQKTMVFQVGPGGALVPMGTRAVADFRKRQQAAEKMESIRHEQ